MPRGSITALVAKVVLHLKNNNTQKKMHKYINDLKQQISA